MGHDRTPLSEIELSIVDKLGQASFPPATASKSFARNLCSGYVKDLSPRGRRFLAFIAQRFRRQYNLTKEEKQWVAEWIDYQEPAKAASDLPLAPIPRRAHLDTLPFS
jgi:hypothetical protein